MRYRSFREFYPFYHIREHSDRTRRGIHVAGSGLVLVLLAIALLTGNAWRLIGMPLVGYGLPGPAASSSRRTGPRPSPIPCGA